MNEGWGDWFRVRVWQASGGPGHSEKNSIIRSSRSRLSCYTACPPCLTRGPWPKSPSTWTRQVNGYQKWEDFFLRMTTFSVQVTQTPPYKPLKYRAPLRTVKGVLAELWWDSREFLRGTVVWLSNFACISRVGNSCQSFHCFAGAVIGGQLKQFETCSSLDVHFTVLDLMSTVLIVTSLMSLACSWTHVDSLDSVATVFQLSWFCSSTCRQFLLLCFGMVLQCVVLDLNVL